MIYHIYWGTAGNAGLYLDEIYQSLKKAGYQQKVFVSYYYPFNYGEKVFFRKTEMEHCTYNGLKRRVFQAIELVVALCKILFAVVYDKPHLVNYSYVSTGNGLILFFLKTLKRFSGCKLVITCHDVVPFANDEKSYNKEMTIKKKIYSQADAFIIHNENSRKDLKRLFCLNDEMIYEHPFPIMDLTKIDNDVCETEIKYDFLFIGHMRKAKGVDLLIEAWKNFHEFCPAAKLCIAGNPATYKEYFEQNAVALKRLNIELKLGFVKDKEYIRLVKQSRCVVFPYNAGTNSGVISTVISLGKNVITSDIEMFTLNPLVPKGSIFNRNNIGALVSLMEKAFNDKKPSDSDRVMNYRSDFDMLVNRVYSKLND